jgi:hypothetical protein
MALHDLKLLGDPNTAQEESGEDHSLAIRKALSAEVFEVVCQFLDHIKQQTRHLERTSPLIVNWAYQAATTYARLYFITEDDQYLACWEILNESLQIVGTRWRIAGENSKK